LQGREFPAILEQSFWREAKRRSPLLDLAPRWDEVIQLALVRDNEQARRLYVRLGFAEYGIETRALKQVGRYYDEVLMAKNLKAD
jgi:hypothetical protein